MTDSRVYWLHWYLGLIGGITLGCSLALFWAIPAAAAGGEIYANSILWSQTTGRINESFSHARGFWWYLVVLPAALFPWSLWPCVLRGFLRYGIKHFLKMRLASIHLFMSVIYVSPALYNNTFFLAFSKQLHFIVLLSLWQGRSHHLMFNSSKRSPFNSDGEKGRYTFIN